MQSSKTQPGSQRSSTGGLSKLLAHVDWAGKALLARRWLLLGWSAMALLVAYGLAWKYGTKSWEARATLLYTPPPVAENHRDVYSPPDLKTLASFVKSQPNLYALRNEWDAPLPVTVLEKLVEATVPTGTRSLVVTLRSDDREKAIRGLDLLISVFQSQIATVRKSTVQERLKDYTAGRDAASVRLTEASGKLFDMCRDNGVDDLKVGVVRAVESVHALQFAIERVVRHARDVIEQQRLVDQQLNDLRTQQAKTDVEEKKAESTQETLADNRRRQDRLRELIDEERRTQEVEALLAAKRQEMERMRPLAEKGIRSRAELERLQAEIGALVARINNNEKIKQWQGELARLDTVVVPKTTQKGAVSPIIQQILFRRLELDLQLVADQEEERQLRQNLAESKTKLERLTALQKQHDALAKDLDGMDLERRKADERVAAARQLLDMGACEFAIVTPPQTAPYPVVNTTRLLFLGLSTIGVLGGVACVLGLATFRASRMSASTARRLGLPVLAEVSSDKQVTEQIRELALRLRQEVGSPGAMIVFSAATTADRPDDMVAALAACYTGRDESVLIVDTRQRTSDMDGHSNGLAEYLNGQIQDPVQSIATVSGSYSLIPAGQQVRPADALAGRRMGQVLNEARARYSITLVIAPPLENRVDLQILAAHAQAIVAVVSTGGGSMTAAKSSLQELSVLGAPVVGSVAITERHRTAI